MRQRLAIAFVCICAGILLFSACGLPNPLPPVQPPFSQSFFLLWADGPESKPFLLATGNFAGTVNRSTAYLRPRQPLCLHIPLTLTLDGNVKRTSPPQLHLTHSSAESGQIALTATLASQRIRYNVDALPFDGTLTFTGGCASGASYIVHGRRPPELLGMWAGDASEPGQANAKVIEILYFASPVEPPSTRKIGYTYADFVLTLTAPACRIQAKSPAPIEIADPPQSFMATLTAADGVTVLAETTTDVLAPTALQAHYTIHGGPCDGQSFDSTLHPR